MKCTIQNTGNMVDDATIHMLRNSGETGVARDGVSLRTGKNSGYQAINLAVQAGASRVVLLGYDMKFDQGKEHWHGKHPRSVPESWYGVYAKLFKYLVDCGAEIINATPGSAIECFPKIAIEEAIQ